MYCDFKQFMNKITVLVAILIALAPTLPAFSENSSRILAQIRGQDSQEFFNEGDQQMEQETQTLENEQSQESTEEREEQNLQAPTQEPTEQQEEQNLERTLNIEQKNPQTPEVQDIPAPGVGDNVPTPPPTGEVEIKLPE
jgi:flagellar biosynthesis component FlhA